eukprot:CAMPEP_0115007250 /NCGR_PEP_ID=MMETSP0216-20121206/21054_1 /TAXON_ID=223996 /ORGANISM="Protocruzia adherens, Strain Boccale" /LENGTH=143 /DNA_ID=CAMNT_0002374129 /DNA_START=261 /DNA_END=692 /DNA_ORIENTATION=+
MVRAHFYSPMRHPLPIYEFNWMDKSLNDRLDRHYELMSFNAHPMQLLIYEKMNEELDLNQSEIESQEKGEKSRYDHMQEQFAEEVNVLMEKHGDEMRPGHVVEVLHKLRSRDRNLDRFTSSDERGPGRSAADYLEVRRPLLDN